MFQDEGHQIYQVSYIYIKSKCYHYFNCFFIYLGRDTPSSQVTENDDVANGPPTPSARINPSAKQCKFDLDDKFGKFEIKSKMQGKYIKLISV